MGDIFLTGTQNQSTNQPSAPVLQGIPELDGTSQGLENTVAALINNVRALSGQVSTNANNLSPQQSSTQSSKKTKLGSFVEISRQTQSVTITDPNSGASVTFKQITQLVLQDTVTQETWTWNL